MKTRLITLFRMLLGSETGEAALDLVVPGASQLKALRQKAAEIHQRLTALNTKAVAAATVDGSPALTDEERAEVSTLKARFAQVEELRAEAERLNEAERNFKIVGKDPDVAAAAKATGVVRVGKDLAADDPMRGFRSPREYLTSVMQAATASRPDPRLAPLRAAVGSDEQSTFSDPYGGFLVPMGMSPNIMALEAEADPIAPLVTRIPMNSPTVSINARTDKNHSTSVSGGLTVTRREQAGDITASRMEFERVTLHAYGLFGLAYATEEVLSDSPQSFVAILEAGFRDEFAAKLIDERINGTGAGEFSGVLNAPCLVTVSKETGQAADTIVKENIDKMAARCWRYGSAVWLANHNTRPQLKSLVQTVGTGGNAVPYFETGGGQERLDGRPIYFSEFASSIGDVGDLILGVWSQYLEGLYQAPAQAESIHVRFVQHERAFKFWLRNDGQCWWRAALTPKRGSTLSPFVALAAR